MKKVFASLMAVLMLVMCVQPCFAAGYESVEEFPSTVNTRDLAINVSARKTGDASFGAPAASFGVQVANASTKAPVDYKVELDMTKVKEFFDREEIADIKTTEAFRNGAVEMDITVEVEYPATAEINGDLTTKGDLLNSGNGIFVESAARVVGTNKLTVKYGLGQELTVGALIDNKETYLANPIFQLDDTFKYSTGSQIVKVKLTGKTTFTFASGKTSEIGFTGEATHIVNVTVINAGGSGGSGGGGGGGGGGGSSKFTVMFVENGGSDVANVNVKSGETANLPTPVKEGYKFEGWYTDSACTKPYDATDKVTKNITLYAKWSEIGGGEEVLPTDDTTCDDFEDVNLEEWYHEGVHYVIENGMMNGTSATSFEPETNVSRAMLVTVLWRAENEPAAAAEAAFTDLVNGQYYVDAVKWANETGVVKGTSDTTFSPETAITREQFATIIYRYAQYKGYDVSVGENTNILSYSDFGKISEYAIPAMQYAVGSGLMKGKTATSLNPADNATRAEMATILYRFFTMNAENAPEVTE